LGEECLALWKIVEAVVNDLRDSLDIVSIRRDVQIAIYPFL
jgi:hypothetical protein